MGLVIFLVTVLMLVVYLFFLGRAIVSKDGDKLKRTVVLGSVLLSLSIILLFVFANSVYAAEETATTTAAPSQDPLALGLKYVGAALAVGLAAIGAGIAVGPIGVSAISVIAEKPEMFGTSLIFIGLAEGIAIYGIAIAILIMFVL
ncbi:MAG: ATP synthase subunit C [Spirochaetia bacterium]|nr:ATP synthase subunit C [Spirochaetota bacterium]MCX8096763.1 ATP synthase subunit C [Spirochaetota bacterium]MDW8112537.1 ATP synthase subunit C [Spirochaetia bacterium]